MQPYHVRIVIPPKPEVLIKLSKEVKKDEPSLLEIEEIVCRDVGISGGILSLANSASFGLRRKPRSIKEAIIFLGSDLLVAFAVSSAIKTAFGKNVQNLDFFWDKTSCMADLSMEIYKNEVFKEWGIPTQEVFTYCLFQECGQAIMMMNFPEYAKKIKTFHKLDCDGLNESETSSYNVNHGYLGFLLASYWGMPSEMCLAIREHANVESYRNESSVQSKKSLQLMVIGHLANAKFLTLKKAYEKDLDLFRDPVISILGIKEDEYDSMLAD